MHAGSTDRRREAAPWWATFLVTLGLLALASRLLIGKDQLATAGLIIGYVAAHWLPAPRVAATRPVEPPSTPAEG